MLGYLSVFVDKLVRIRFDDEDESLLSLESLVSLVSLVSLSPELLLVFENERLLSELSGA